MENAAPVFCDRKYEAEVVENPRPTELQKLFDVVENERPCVTQ